MLPTFRDPVYAGAIAVARNVQDLIREIRSRSPIPAHYPRRVLAAEKRIPQRADSGRSHGCGTDYPETISVTDPGTDTAPDGTECPEHIETIPANAEIRRFRRLPGSHIEARNRPASPSVDG